MFDWLKREKFVLPPEEYQRKLVSEIEEKLQPGDFVKAPFGTSEITGVIWPYEQITKKKFS